MPQPNNPELLLKALRKLESNRTCPNCGTFNQYGFSSVCVKYKTFVCDLCKTSHQAISHRVKSISMSTWTLGEVHELSDECCGGNDAARYTWLKNAPTVGGRYKGGCRPKSGDKIEIFKQFIIDCYENQLFKSSEPYQPSTVCHSLPYPLEKSTQPSAKQSTVINKFLSPHELTTTAVAPVMPTSIAVLDLLSDDFIPTTNISPITITTQYAASQSVVPFSSTPSSTSTSADSEPFSDFFSAPPPTPPTIAQSFSPADSDSFSDFHRAPPVPPMPSNAPNFNRASFTEICSAVPSVTSAPTKTFSCDPWGDFMAAPIPVHLPLQSQTPVRCAPVDICTVMHKDTQPGLSASVADFTPASNSSKAISNLFNPHPHTSNPLMGTPFNTLSHEGLGNFAPAGMNSGGYPAPSIPLHAQSGIPPMHYQYQSNQPQPQLTQSIAFNSFNGLQSPPNHAPTPSFAYSNGYNSNNSLSSRTTSNSSLTSVTASMSMTMSGKALSSAASSVKDDQFGFVQGLMK